MDVLASMKGWWKNLSEIDNNHLFIIIIISCQFMIPTGFCKVKCVIVCVH